jgi:hypothetical protein
VTVPAPILLAPHASREARLDLLYRERVEVGVEAVAVDGHGVPSETTEDVSGLRAM